MSAVGVNTPFHGTAFQHIVTIESLPDVVLLEVFDHCREEKLRKGQALQQPYMYQWYQLVPAHICQRWRQIIIASPTRLRLSILCSWELPVTEILRCSPAGLLISIHYRNAGGVGSRPWAPESISGALLALEYLDRASHVVIDALTLEEDQLLLMINRPAPKLETLSIECIRDSQLTLPHTFTFQGNARLRRLALYDISNPFQLTPPASVTNFSLSLDFPKGSTRIDWLENLASQLRAMPQLERLDLELDTLPPGISIDRGGASISLPRLSGFIFSGLCCHLEDLIAVFDTPVLSKLHIDIVDQTTPIVIPQLSRYIQSSFKFHASVAYVGIASDFAYIKTYSEEGPSIQLRVINHCGTATGEDTEVMKPTIIAINSALEPVFSSVRTLVLGFDNDSEAERLDIDFSSAFNSEYYWNEALKGFKSVITLRVDTDVA
ncbi:hypothetical protein BC834DRAFT_972398 [Gloeopeniophorella convolvens]|nr:hypothetical protein BC834DRAFT_972398 [Gloeopeniophorella convolvens]